MASSSPPPYIYMSNKPHQHQLHQLCLGNELIRLMTCPSSSNGGSQIVIGKVCSIPFELDESETWTFCWSILESGSGNVINGRVDVTAEYPEFSFVAKAKSKYTIVGTFMTSNSSTPQAECILMLEPRNYGKESEEELYGDIDRWFGNRWNYMDAHLGDDLSTME